MKYRSLCLLLLIFIGGNACSSNNSVDLETVAEVKASNRECPQEPTATLASSSVKSISLNRGAIAESGIVSSNKHLGYTFAAKSGQKLQYQTEDDLCLWLYSPENKLVTTTELPATGKYTLQVATPQGSKSFDLSIGFEPERVTRTENKYSSSKVASKSTFRFKRADFPKSLCGDSKPSNPRDYPVNFYPVHVPYSENNLSIARSYFCQDSFPKISKDTGDKVVQISSFTSKRKAEDFGKFVGSRFSRVRIGSPTIVYE